MSRVLLVNPPKKVPLLDWSFRYPPLGLMSIAAALEGHEVEILDLKIEKLSGGKLLAKLSSFDIVGVSALTPSIDSALEICRAARGQNAFTVLGGVHPSLVPGIAADPGVDVVVRGEGELTMRQIADGAPLDSIAGISYSVGASVRHNPDRPPADLDSLPPPRRDLMARFENRYRAFGRRLDAVSTARGCPFNCSFCCVPAVWKGYRELSPGGVIEEIRRASRAEVIAIVDDNFCQDMKRVEAICDLILREGLNDRIYSVFSRVDSIVRHPDVVAKMAAANMRIVFIGIEAASQEALDRMNKKTRMEDIRRACEILERNGIVIWAGHIIGNLNDTYDDVEALIDLSLRLPVDIAQFTVITPYPGTGLYRYASENGLIDEYDYTEYCECEPHMHTPHLSRMELLELEIKAYRKFYGFRASARRTRRWARSRDKEWLITRNSRTIASFLKFENRSARYLWKVYRETVGKTEGTRIRSWSPLVSTPVLYSLGSGLLTAAVTLLLTMVSERFFGEYSSLPAAYRAFDLLVAALLVAFVVSAAVTPFAVRAYRKGWIYSVRRRRPPARFRSVGMRSLINGGLLAAAAFAATFALLLVLAFTGFDAGLTYRLKEILVTSVAFTAACVSSYLSIRAVRNGEFRRNASASRGLPDPARPGTCL